MPAGTTATFNPQSFPAPGSGSSTMTITVSSNSFPGSYPVSVAGTGGGIVRYTIVNLTVSPMPNFVISASPLVLSVGQGQQGNSPATTLVCCGFNNAINLSASGVPSGTNVNFNPSTI